MVRRVVFALVPLVVLAAATELACRRIDRTDPVEAVRIGLDFDANLMWGLSSKVPSPDYLPNSDGLRGPELTEKAAGTVRILTLGDSSIYGDMVHYDSVFSSVLQRRLNATPGPKVEVVDGGIPGYSSVQSIGVYDKVKGKVQPDIVIIGCLWSDAFPADQTDREWAAQLNGSYAPWRPVTDLLTTMSSYSAAARVGRRRVHDLLLPTAPSVIKIGWLDYAPKAAPTPGLAGAPNAARPSVSADGSPPPGGNGVGVAAAPGSVAANGPPPPRNGSPGPRKGPETDAEKKKMMSAKADDEGSLEPLPERLVGPAAMSRTMRVPMDEYVDNLSALASRARADGALPIFLLLPHPFDDRQQSLPLLGATYRAAMRDTAARRDVPLVDGAAWFVAHSCGDCVRFADTIHPNEAGHGVVADAVEELLTTNAALSERLGRAAGLMPSVETPAGSSP